MVQSRQGSQDRYTFEKGHLIWGPARGGHRREPAGFTSTLLALAQEAARTRFDSLTWPSASSGRWTRPWITAQGAHVTCSVAVPACRCTQKAACTALRPVGGGSSARHQAMITTLRLILWTWPRGGRASWCCVARVGSPVRAASNGHRPPQVAMAMHSAIPILPPSPSTVLVRAPHSLASATATPSHAATQPHFRFRSGTATSTTPPLPANAHEARRGHRRQTHVRCGWRGHG